MKDSYPTSITVVKDRGGCLLMFCGILDIKSVFSSGQKVMDISFLPCAITL